MAGIETFFIPYNNEGEFVSKNKVIGDATQAKIDSFKARNIGDKVGDIFGWNH